MANMIVEDGKFVLSQEISGAGTVTKTLSTENTFVDKDIEIITTTAAGALGSGTGSVEASTTATGLLGTASASQPSSGAYVKVEGSANVGVTTSGWIDSGEDVDVSIADVYYPVNEAAQTIGGGGMSTTSATTALSSNGLSNGSTLDTTKKIALTTTDANGYYELESTGSATVTRSDVTAQFTTAGYVEADQSPVVVVASGTESVTNTPTKYYVLQSTLSSDSVTPSTSAQTVTIGPGYYHDSRTVTVAGITGVTPTTGLSNSGLSTYFTDGTSSSYDVSITPTYSTNAGFVSAQTNTNNGGIGYYNIKAQTVTETTTTVSGTSASRGTRTESVGWNDTAGTLATATFANTGTSGTTYVDISATTAAPVLVSGDYLYINAGWTDNLKISLARLVPDGSDVHGHGDYILSGHSAYDDDGVLVAGTIQTYDGTYVVG